MMDSREEYWYRRNYFSLIFGLVNGFALSASIFCNQAWPRYLMAVVAGAATCDVAYSYFALKKWAKRTGGNS